MANRQAIARQAAAAALRMRINLGYGVCGPICVYDLAERLGIEVRFVDIPSMEGMYLRSDTNPTILISSLRPSGRRAFTCAHEIGHHVNGDGTRVDELNHNRRHSATDPKEFAADCFAGILLMPRVTVERAFSSRKWSPDHCTPDQVYTISNFFGVGYATLIHHMRSGLHLLSSSNAAALLKVRPRIAQARALGMETLETVHIVDRFWTGRPVDVETGELIFARGCTKVEGKALKTIEDTETGSMYLALHPGLGRIENGSEWSAFIRVARPNFVGRSIFRHLEVSGEEQRLDN